MNSLEAHVMVLMSARAAFSSFSGEKHRHHNVKALAELYVQLTIGNKAAIIRKSTATCSIKSDHCRVYCLYVIQFSIVAQCSK